MMPSACGGTVRTAKACTAIPHRRRWMSAARCPPVTPFTSIQEFKAALIADKAIFIKGFTEKFLCYALGRPIGYGDHLVVEQIIAEAAKHEYRLQEIIQATVASTFFQTQ